MIKKQGQKYFRLNTVILTKVKLQPMNYVALPNIASNNSSSDAIRLVTV